MGTAAIASREGTTPSLAASCWPTRFAVAADHLMSRTALSDGTPEQPYSTRDGQ